MQTVVFDGDAFLEIEKFTHGLRAAGSKIYRGGLLNGQERIESFFGFPKPLKITVCLV